MSNPVISEYGTKCWYNEKGQLHREDGPAKEYIEGDKEYWINGKIHREDGPAIECQNGDKLWCLNGKVHREDGPAVEWSDGTIRYYINNILYNSLDEGLMDQAIR